MYVNLPFVLVQVEDYIAVHPEAPEMAVSNLRFNYPIESTYSTCTLTWY